ncbi:MAG TPA: glycosyltransferase family 4 protein [Stellaceae bacterium]|nr:glycosyltransferase family 4 protein [Stellaceae bacterium]
MTIVFIVPGPLGQLTGGYLFDKRVIEGLRAAGRAVDVRELPGAFFPSADAAALAAADAVLSALPEEDAAIIDGLALPAFAQVLTPTSRRRLIGFVHHPLARETGLAEDARETLAGLEARLLTRLKGVLCPSAGTAWALEEYGVARERIAIAPPGTEKPAEPARRSPRAGPLRLLAVGTISPRKGHLLLVEALAEVADRPWELSCIGSLTRDPATLAALERAIGRHGFGERVKLLGERPPEQLAEAYAAADVFVLPSYHEGYGMAFAEALAHGLPVVATSAVAETVPAEAALLVPPGDVAALAAALRLLMDNAPLRARLAMGAAKAGAALPDWQTAIDRWIAAFDRLSA